MNRHGALNRVYRIVWNAAKCVWQAVCETGKGRGKQTSIVRLAHRAGLLGGVVLSAGALAAPAAGELPTGGTVVSGSASISSSGTRMDINQTSQRAALDWQTFNIGSAAQVHFEQPSGGVALNRVIGSDASQIYGKLTSTGQVFLVNPNGVLFAPGAQVDTGGLVASTLNIGNADFMNGNYVFSGGSSSAIINQGNITVAPGGTIALIGAKVINEGSLTAEKGNVLLGGGSKVTLDMGGPVKLQIENDQLETLIRNGGVIKADGGTVWLTSQAAATLASSVINNTGVIEAQSLATGEKGEIVLFAHGGEVQVGGVIKAEGGFVETSGKVFSIAEGATIKAAQWLIDPVNITIDGTLATALGTALGSGSVTISTAGSNTPDTSSGESGSDGNIDINADVTWSANNTLTLRADNNISVNANITHTGTSAGGVIFLYGQGTADGGTSSYSATGTVTSPSVQWRKGSDLNSTRYAIVDGNYFIGGKYIEIGICGPAGTNCTGGAGKFGTTNKPSLFFGRASGSGIGMTGDADGFGAGADLRIDYFLPGTPAEQFTVGYTGASDTQNFATTANSGTFSFLPLGADGSVRMTYSAVLNSSLKVEQTISLKSTDAFFNNSVTLTNVGGGSLDGVRFVRSFDPDNTVDKDGSGGYSNTQKIDQTLAAGDGANVVSATSAASGSYYTASGNKTSKIIYYSTDAATTVGYGGEFFSGTNIAQMVSKAATESKGSSQTADQGIGIIYTAGTLGAGSAKTFSYLTSLDNRDISVILGELGAAAGARPPAVPTPVTEPTVPVTTAITTAQAAVQTTPLPQNTNTPTPSTASLSAPPAPVVTQQGSLPVYDLSGGLAFVQVPSPAAGAGGAGAGSTAGGSGGNNNGGGNGASGGTTTSVASLADLPADAGGRDASGFMRVFVVGGGLNLPTSLLGNANRNEQ